MPTMTEHELDQHLAEGKPLPADQDLVIGEDFHKDEYERGSEDMTAPDAVSEAVGTQGYVEDYVAHECFQSFSDGSRTDAEVFDRYYFPPDNAPEYDGPAPLLIDIIRAEEVAERAAEENAKHLVFKRAWAKVRDVRYVILAAEDLLLGTDALRAKLLGGEIEGPAPQAKSETARKRGGVQHPRGE